MTASDLPPLSTEELAAEAGAALPDKEVMSLLDLNADLNLALDVAAPIDLGVAANANVAAPINAAVGANILSVGSADAAVAHQGVNIDQGLSGYAVAHAPQHSSHRPDRARDRRRHRRPADDAGRRRCHGDRAQPVLGRSSGDLLNVERQRRRGRQARRPDRRRGRRERQRRGPDRRLRLGQRGLRSTRTRPPSPTRPGSITQHLDGDARRPRPTRTRTIQQ